MSLALCTQLVSGPTCRTHVPGLLGRENGKQRRAGVRETLHSQQYQHPQAKGSQVAWMPSKSSPQARPWWGAPAGSSVLTG